MKDFRKGMVAYWTTFEWFGWRFYLGHLRWLVPTVYFADPRLLRFFAGVPSLGVGVWLLGDSIAYQNVGFRFIAPLIPENALAASFLLHTFGTWWRLGALRDGMLWSCWFGALGMILYVGYPVFVYLDLGRVTGQGIAMAAWGLVITYLTARIGRGQDTLGA